MDMVVVALVVVVVLDVGAGCSEVDKELVVVLWCGGGVGGIPAGIGGSMSGDVDNVL